MATSTITNTVTTPGGTPLAGIPVIIRLMPAGGFRADGSEVARIHQTTTDNSGVWSATLERTADITPSGTYYEVEEKIPGAPRRHLFQVGNASTTLQASLITQPPPVDVPTALTQEAADARYVLSPGTFGSAVDVQPVVGGSTADGGTEDSYARVDHTHAFAIDTDYLKNDSGTLTFSDQFVSDVTPVYNAPRGLVGVSPLSGSAGGSETPLTGSVIHTADAARSYKVTAQYGVFTNTDKGNVTFRLKCNGATVATHSFHVGGADIPDRATGTVIAIAAGLSGVTTWSATLQCISTSRALNTQIGPCQIIVEDVGPA